MHPTTFVETHYVCIGLLTEKFFFVIHSHTISIKHLYIILRKSRAETSSILEHYAEMLLILCKDKTFFRYFKTIDEKYYILYSP